MAKIKVIKNKEKPETVPVLAEAIVKISEAMEKLSNSDLNERAIIVLIIDACGTCIGSNTYNKRKPTRKEIKAILDGMRQLKTWYCK